MSRKSKMQNRNQGTFVGALLIESIAVVVMIGLFFVVQKERTNRPTADEFVRPKVIEEAYPNHLRPNNASQGYSTGSVSHVAQVQVATDRSWLVSIQN